jgi:hypothetical protein
MSILTASSVLATGVRAESLLRGATERFAGGALAWPERRPVLPRLPAGLTR